MKNLILCEFRLVNLIIAALRRKLLSEARFDGFIEISKIYFRVSIKSYNDYHPGLKNYRIFLNDKIFWRGYKFFGSTFSEKISVKFKFFLFFN